MENAHLKPRFWLSVVASLAVSYTHLRAHETDTSLFVGSVRCVIRDSTRKHPMVTHFSKALQTDGKRTFETEVLVIGGGVTGCLLYTSPSPRDGHLSIRRQRQMCNKRQHKETSHGDTLLEGPANRWKTHI